MGVEVRLCLLGGGRGGRGGGASVFVGGEVGVEVCLCLEWGGGSGGAPVW